MTLNKTGTICRFVLVSLLLLTGLPSNVLHAAEPLQRAKDLSYGQVLYAYHQGHAFEALSLLNVAALRGGIKGHGEHPRLVEGGLLLSYGMVQEAKALFETILKEQLKVDDRNTAWFYLGKVFYLQQNTHDALSSFKKINQAALKATDPEKFYEMLYLKGQMSASIAEAEATQWLKELPSKHIFRFYLRYNQALGFINEQKLSQAANTLSQLAEDLQARWSAMVIDRGREDTSPVAASGEILVDEIQEIRALLDQTRLTLAQLQLQAEQLEAALQNLKGIDKHGPFAAQALFLYSLAASQLQRYELALSALTDLETQKHFNPWRQQSPYALANLYEQMFEPSLAMQAYQAAVGHYEALQKSLESERATMNEETLLSALGIKERIGQADLHADAYGRLQTDAGDFNFATLLASETFQGELSELHELYVLQNSLIIWAKQLDSFELMLETRLSARREKLKALQVELDEKDVSSWQQKTAHFQEQIEQAVKDENPYFFMTDEQLAYFQRIQKTKTRLQALTDTHPDKNSYITRLQRIQAYFDWWVADQYTVNRWRTVKALKQLQAEMSDFQEAVQGLKSQQELDTTHRLFSQRLEDGRQRLQSLQTEIESSLSRSRNKLLSLVDQAMQAQLTEVAAYLLASREALARVSDQILNQELTPAPEQQPLEEGNAL